MQLLLDWLLALLLTLFPELLATALFWHFATRASWVRAYSNTFLPYLRKVREDHHAMLTALRAGRRDALIGLLRGHLQPSKTAYITAYKQRFTERNGP